MTVHTWSVQSLILYWYGEQDGSTVTILCIFWSLCSYCHWFVFNQKVLIAPIFWCYGELLVKFVLHWEFKLKMGSLILQYISQLKGELQAKHNLIMCKVETFDRLSDFGFWMDCFGKVCSWKLSQSWISFYMDCRPDDCHSAECKFFFFCWFFPYLRFHYWK